LAVGDAVTLSLSGSAGTLQYRVTDDVTDNGGWYTIAVELVSNDGLTLDHGDTVSVYAERANAPVGDGLALANRVNIVRAVEWWKAQDAAFGVIGFDQTGALQAPRDGFNRHRYTLTPLKEGWGIA
jgi:hypothetical protein